MQWPSLQRESGRVLLRRSVVGDMHTAKAVRGDERGGSLPRSHRRGSQAAPRPAMAGTPGKPSAGMLARGSGSPTFNGGCEEHVAADLRGWGWLGNVVVNNRPPPRQP